MRIVCAVDGSEYAQWAVDALQALAAREPQEVMFIHVVDRAAIRAAQGKNPRAINRALSASERAGQLLLRDSERLGRVALSQAMSAPRTRTRSVLAYGPPAATIARQARRHKADLILVGSRGLSDIKTFLLGSVSRQSCQRARKRSKSPSLSLLIYWKNKGKRENQINLYRIQLPALAVTTVPADSEAS